MDRRSFLRSLSAILLAGAPGCGHLGGRSGQSEASAIPKRPLGRTGVEVSALALGGVVGMKREPTSDFQPAELANAALDLGITYFDTAPAYNDGQSEKNYGEVLARRRGEVFLATKTGQRSYDGAMRDVESSLERLGTDHVDLLQIHGARAGEDLERWGKADGVLAALWKLRDQKVTRFIGVTGHDSAEVMERAIQLYEFDTVLTTFNPTAKRRLYRKLVIPAALEKNMGILAMKVMGGGLGSLADGNPIENDGASNHDDAPRQASSGRLIRYALGLPVSSAVVGMGSIAELTANVRAARDLAPLSSEERRDVEILMS